MPRIRVSLPMIGGCLGLCLAEVYLYFTVASPRLQGIEIPTSAIFWRFLALAPLFGAFGLAIGTALAIILRGALSASKTQKNHRNPPQS